MVTCPSAGNEQQAPLALQVLRVGQWIGGLGCHRIRRGDYAIADADYRDRLELQALHAVHAAQADAVAVTLAESLATGMPAACSASLASFHR